MKPISVPTPLFRTVLFLFFMIAAGITTWKGYITAGHCYYAAAGLSLLFPTMNNDVRIVSFTHHEDDERGSNGN